VTDADLLAGFEACTLDEFHHADHVRVAWLVLRRMPYDAALEHFVGALQAFAAAKGASQKYDDALTRRYVARIHQRMRSEASWPEFARANPDLLVWPPAGLYEDLR
jgi:hypothetical protein